MSIEISADTAKAILPLLEQHGGLPKIAEGLRNRYGLDKWIFRDLALDELDTLGEIAKAANERGLMMKITSLSKVLRNPAGERVKSLSQLVPGITAWLKMNRLDGWVYTISGDEPMAWLVTEVSLEMGRMGSDSYVWVKLRSAGAKIVGSDQSSDSAKSITFSANDLGSLSVEALMTRRGIYHEDASMKALYESAVAKFIRLRLHASEQLVATRGIGRFAEDGRSYMGHSTPLAVDGIERFINEEDLASRTYDGDNYNLAGSSPFWEKLGHDDCILPVHPEFYCFSLLRHCYSWVHVNYLEPYEYDASVREKLILPLLHRDLLDVLVNDMAVFEDVVRGKSGGTTVLCTGLPGLGKTLTAEAYSEIVARPLYRIHSGQLGTTAEQVEKNLTIILRRAQRWNAVMLLDEADVYIRRRGDDIMHNAIVASFLRTLEYFSGLLFMTSNRVGDIDDAILSRCIAHIRYEAPDEAMSVRLWEVLSSQTGTCFDAALISELVAMFKGVSGRDIKELIKLTTRYARARDKPLSADLFRQIAMFRGLV